MARHLPLVLVLLLFGGGVAWLLTRHDADTPAPDLATSLPGALSSPDDVAAPPRAPLLTGRGADAPAGATPPATAPGTTPAPEGAVPEGWFALSGRIVEATDDGERAVVDVPVALHEVDGDVLGAARASARSGADGAFRLLIPEEGLPPRATRGPVAQVRAVHDDGRIATRPVHGRPDRSSPMGTTREWPLGDLRLLRRIPVQVIVRGASPAAIAQVHVQPVAPRSQPAWSMPTPVDDETPRTVLVPEEGLVRLAAVAEGHGRATAILTFPRREDAPIVLELARERTLVIEVVDDADGTPIAGALLALHEIVSTSAGNSLFPWWPAGAPLVTGDDGKATVRGHPDPGGAVRADATAAGYPPSGMRPNWTHIPADATTCTIRLKRAITARWRIADDSPTIPADGTTVGIRARAGSGSGTTATAGRIEAGHLLIDGCPADDFGAEAVAANGAVARLWYRSASEEQQPIAFRPARTVTVHVRDADGQPVVGAGVTARNQGNNVLAGPLDTDAEGIARLDSLGWEPHDALADIYVGPSRSAYGGRNVGSVNLVAGDAELDVVLPRARTVIAHVTVDGQPRSPAGLSLMLEGYLALEPVEGAVGRLQGEWTPRGTPTRLQAAAFATGLLPLNLDIEVPEAPGQPIEVRLDFESGGSFRTKVLPPADKRMLLRAQRWQDEQASWGPGGAQTGRPHFLQETLQPDGEGWVEVGPVAAGRYRLIDSSSGVVSEPVEVVPGRETPDGLIDLSRTGWVKGRAEVPEGVDLQLVTVIAAGDGLDGPITDPQFDPATGGFEQRSGLSARFDRDGVFWLRVPGDRPLALHLEGHGVRPPSGTAPVVVTTPREDVVLRGVAAPLARLRLATPLRLNSNPGRPRPCAVDWAHGAQEGRIMAMLSAGADAVEISGLAPGTGTLWIDGSVAAPLVLRDITIPGDRDVDLGEITPTEGRRLALRILPPKQGVAPRLTFFVQRAAPRAYTRRLDLGTLPTEPSVHHITGLEPGPHVLRSMAIMGGPGGTNGERAIDIPEDGELEITIDLSGP